MANLTAARDPKWREDKVAELKATTGGKFYAGGLVVFSPTTGLLSRSVTTASSVVAGVALENKDLTNAAAGSRVRVQRSGTFEFAFPAGGLTDANVGDEVQAADDQSVAAFSTGIRVGRITEVISANRCRVSIDATAA